MANRIKSYILAPTLESPPEGAILLGNIIASPDTPEASLNTQIPNQFMENMKILEAHKRGWKDEQGAHHNISGGVFAQFLQMIGLGGDIDGGHEGSSHHRISAKQMDIYWFNPDASDIEKSIEDSGVKKYLDFNNYRRPVFLVTGLMIARGASAVHHSMKGAFLHTKIGIDLTAAGAPVTVGPKASLTSHRDRDIAFDEASDFVLAYRLTRIKCTRTARVSSKEHTKGALYGTNPERYDLQHDDDDSDTTTPEIEEVTAAQLGASAIIISDASEGPFEVVSLPA